MTTNEGALRPSASPVAVLGRSIAGDFGFFTFTQCGDRPERILISLEDWIAQCRFQLKIFLLSNFRRHRPICRTRSLWASHVTGGGKPAQRIEPNKPIRKWTRLIAIIAVIKSFDQPQQNPPNNSGCQHCDESNELLPPLTCWP
jgi:hypothetical protein